MIVQPCCVIYVPFVAFHVYEVRQLTADSPKTGEIMVITNRLTMGNNVHMREALNRFGTRDRASYRQRATQCDGSVHRGPSVFI